MQVKRVLLILTLIGIAVVGQGCIAVAVGVGAAGTIAYVRGDLEAVESHSLDEVYEATLEAVKELELQSVYKTKDALTATITAYDAQDKKVKIILKKTADQITKISIRIGTFGSETKSRLIYQAIQDNLPQQLP
jgi:hypothetical protein